MKSVILAAIVALTAAPLAAQTTPAPAAPAVAAPAAPAAEGTAKFTLDTPIETIAADPAAKAVLDTDLQNITSHPMYDQFKGMSLNQVQPMSQGALSDAALAKVKADLAAIK
ncbi:hypothetical protein [Sphingomonas sp.]|uniref:hypothetical protein n=1 Tax=Sphingomonas sp. TaxID=28214 RepID=UPI00333FE3B9